MRPRRYFQRALGDLPLQERSRELEQAAYGAWLKQALTDTAISVNGTALSTAVLEAAIDAKYIAAIDSTSSAIRFLRSSNHSPSNDCGTTMPPFGAVR